MASARLLLFRVSDRLRSNGHGEDLFSVKEVRREGEINSSRLLRGKSTNDDEKLLLFC